MVQLLVLVDAMAGDLPVVQSEAVSSLFIDGLEVARTSTDAGTILVGVTEIDAGRVVLALAVENHGPASVDFGPASITATVRTDDADEQHVALSTDDVLDEVRRSADARVRKLANTQALMGALAGLGGQTDGELAARATYDVAAMAEVKAEVANALSGIEGSVLRTQTLGAPGDLSLPQRAVGDAWIPFDSGEVKHLVVRVQFGGEVASLEFGDPHYRNQRCPADLTPETTLIGWVELDHGPAPKVGTRWAPPPEASVFLVGPSESNGWKADRDSFVCSVARHSTFWIGERPVRVKGGDVWVPLFGNG
ncbi:MAG: hypothetical protein ABMA64_32075 [Myxococcota bacterium]